ncbi:PaaI family thioesterase [Aquibaculum arenosum]|uniref:PaaI family thioesterase n=1 Tax=Aquibaculum arenosum TaxID=3032591 RepID=A0ABT5YKE5_9PROT|nr:PaaI family thioesterase [Fodinicurvata sp. CAU 1616]MDF2095421.1 PaaI family thioesterase [Fodinicurvata sp. CAU 1616]
MSTIHETAMTPETGLPYTGPYQDLLGYDIARLADGRPVVRMQVEAQHLNQFAIAHGGVALALLDVAGGLAVHARRPEMAGMATVNMNTAFLEVVQPGLVFGIGRIERLGGTLAYTAMALHAGAPEGALLATAQGVYRIFAAKSR